MVDWIGKIFAWPRAVVIRKDEAPQCAMPVGSQAKPVVAVRPELTQLTSAFPKLAKLPQPTVTFVDEFRDAKGKIEKGINGNYSSSLGIRVLRTLPSEPVGLTFGDWLISGEGREAAIVHEYGHHVFFRQPRSVQEKFEVLFARGPAGEGYDKAKVLWASKVSKYGSTNGQELFAESFSAYTHPEYKAGMLPKPVEDTMARIVGKRAKVK